MSPMRFIIEQQFYYNSAFFFFAAFCGHVGNASSSFSSSFCESNACTITSVRNDSQNLLPSSSGRSDGGTSSVEIARSFNGNASSSQNNSDRSHRQKGPRIAKVV